MGGPSGQQGGGSGASNKKARKDTDVSGAEAVYSKNTSASDKKISSNISNDKPSSNETFSKYDVTGTLSDPNEKDDTAAKASLFREQGVTNYRNQEYKTPVGTLLGEVLAPASRYNRDFFKNEVLGKGGFKDISKKDFERKTATEQEKIYGNYFQDRQAGLVDAYGNLSPGVSVENVAYRRKDGTMTTRKVTRKTDGNGAKSIEQPKVASQMDNSDVKSSMIIADKIAPQDTQFTQDVTALANKRKGRRKTILTSVTGDEDAATLGKRTLLGG